VTPHASSRTVTIAGDELGIWWWSAAVWEN
jgi:hypothetical protein